LHAPFLSASAPRWRILLCVVRKPRALPARRPGDGGIQISLTGAFATPGDPGATAYGDRSSATAVLRNVQWLTPYLTVKDSAKAIAFHERAIGFVCSNRMEHEKGIQHVDLQYEAAMVVMFAPTGTDGAP
jgi:hypothetical protein